MKEQRTTVPSTQFLNVDLDVYSGTDLQPLVSAFGKKVMVLHVGRQKRTYSAHLELRKITKTADSTIRAFCSLIRSLPVSARKLWNSTKTRDFNIGVQAEAQPLSYELALDYETLKAAVEVGARIVLTVYAPDRPEAR